MNRQLTDQEIENAVSAIFNECIETQFGLWVIGLFFWWPDLKFNDQKRAFFCLLRRLLDEGYAKFVKPDVNVYYNKKNNPKPKISINDIEAHWDAPTDEIIDYLKDKWPASATHQNDLDLNAYFYEIPALIWKGDDGRWHGS